MILVTLGSDFAAKFTKLEEDLASLTFADAGKSVNFFFDLKAQDEIRQVIGELTTAISLLRKEVA